MRINVDLLAESINNIAKQNRPVPGLPISRTIPEAAALYAAEYDRLAGRSHDLIHAVDCWCDPMGRKSSP
jgi:hypothetical protein